MTTFFGLDLNALAANAYIILRVDLPLLFFLLILLLLLLVGNNHF